MDMELDGSLQDTSRAPPDTHKKAYLIFIVMGVGALFPWNCFLNAFDYFKFLYPDFPFEFILSLLYNYPSLLVLFLSVKYGAKVSFTSRICVSLVIDFVVFLSVPIITIMLSRGVSLWLTLACVFITGCANAVLFGSILGLSALFPPEYTGAVMTGNGIAGVLSSVLRIATKASGKGVQTSSTLFFGIAAFVIVFCLGCFWLLMRLDITRHYILQNDKMHETSKEEMESLVGHGRETSVKAVFLKVWHQALLVFTVFFVTLSLFPGVSSLIVADSHNASYQDWFPIILMTIFMVGDFIGRFLPKLIVVFSERTLAIPTLGRLAFFPLFILCVKSRVFHHDYAAFVIMLFFSITNGYCATLGMMFGPTKVEAHEKETAGTMMSFFLNLGIFVSIHFSLLLLYLITGSIGISF